jgi:hypothetical protein
MLTPYPDRADGPLRRARARRGVECGLDGAGGADPAMLSAFQGVQL